MAGIFATPVGADALLVDIGDPTFVAAFDAHARQYLSGKGGSPGEPQARDIVPAARSILIDGITGVTPAQLAQQIATWEIEPLAVTDGPLVTIPVTFDGPDVGQVAQLWDMTADAVVQQVLDCEFRVAFSGFAPGFGYLAGLPSELAVPRLGTPRTRVPAGSFGLAGEYAGVYPRDSPGGWQLLGTAVGVVMWDVHREPPALLAPGTRVRVTDASNQTPQGKP